MTARTERIARTACIERHPAAPANGIAKEGPG